MSIDDIQTSSIANLDNIEKIKRYGSIFVTMATQADPYPYIKRCYLTHAYQIHSWLHISELDTYIANLEEDFQSWQKDLDRGPSDDFQTATQTLLETVNDLSKNLNLLDESIG